MENSTKTSTATPDTLVESVAMRDPVLGETMEQVREIVRELAPALAERVRYGGVMFGNELLGVFPRKKHVTVEFSRGIEMSDPQGVLQGSGKYRRHILVRSVADIEATHLADYIRRTVML